MPREGSFHHPQVQSAMSRVRGRPGQPCLSITGQQTALGVPWKAPTATLESPESMVGGAEQQQQTPSLPGRKAPQREPHTPICMGFRPWAEWVWWLGGQRHSPGHHSSARPQEGMKTG